MLSSYSQLIELPPDKGFYKDILEPKNGMVELLSRVWIMVLVASSCFGSSDKPSIFRQAERRDEETMPMYEFLVICRLMKSFDKETKGTNQTINHVTVTELAEVL